MGRRTRVDQTAGDTLKTFEGGWAERTAALKEPTGFATRSDSVLSWVGGTRTFTIAPTGDYFDYYIHAKRYRVGAADSIAIADTSGTHAIYYDGATLSAIVNPDHDQFDNLICNMALVGLVYWNATDGTAYVLGDERHGTNMSGKTHEWAHDITGAKWIQGLALSGYVEDDPNNDASLTFELTNGEFYDEDLEHEIVDGAPATQYAQQLNGGDAELPILYRDDIDGSWTEDVATTLPYKTLGAGRLAYNNDDGDGTFSQIEVTDNRWVSMTIIATNDWQYPIKAVQGQNEYTSVQTAIADANAEKLAWGDLPTPEFTVLYRLVMRTKDTYGSTPKAQIVDVTDFRRSGLSGAAATDTSIAHAATTEQTPDDHHTEVHTLLDGDQHSDTAVDIPTRGSIIRATSASLWDELPIGTQGQFLSSGILDTSWIDISDLAADATPDDAADFLMTYDTSAGFHKKVLIDNLRPGVLSVVTYPFSIPDPVVLTAPASYMIGFCQNAQTVVAVIAQTDVGTVDFNVEKRAQTSPFAAGTDIDAAEFTANAAGIDDTTISAPAISAGTWLDLHPSAVASSPTVLRGAIITTRN